MPQAIKQKLDQMRLNSVMQDALLSQAIYTIRTDADSKEQIQEMAGNGTELVLVTDELASGAIEGQSQYRAALLVNHLTKQITIVTAGTRCEETNTMMVSDLFDDLLMMSNKLPYKATSAKALNKVIIDNFGEQIKDYTIHYTGHSLGAALSDIAATDMATQLSQAGMLQQNQISSVTFDNPGVKNIIAANCVLSDSVKNSVRFEAYNNRENFINTMGPGMGEVYTIEPTSQESRGSLSMLVKNMTTPLCELVDNVTPNKLTQLATFFTTPWLVLLQCSKILAYGSPMKQINEHSISNHVTALQEEITALGQDQQDMGIMVYG